VERWIYSNTVYGEDGKCLDRANLGKCMLSRMGYEASVDIDYEKHHAFVEWKKNGKEGTILKGE
jgi:hypothetical protein